MSSRRKDLRYVHSAAKFLDDAYLALSEHFSSREDFKGYFNSIAGDDRKNLFLKIASFYLYLVKRGDWVVTAPGSDPVVDYLTNTYKYIAIFSLIESLLGKQFIDFYSFLVGRKSLVQFPIADKEQLVWSIQRRIRIDKALRSVLPSAERRSTEGSSFET